ncbi:hypothetical protein BsWGS_03164 [Bradybaena similaris]
MPISDNDDQSPTRSLNATAFTHRSQNRKLHTDPRISNYIARNSQNPAASLSIIDRAPIEQGNQYRCKVKDIICNDQIGNMFNNTDNFNNKCIANNAVKYVHQQSPKGDLENR